MSQFSCVDFLLHVAKSCELSFPSTRPKMEICKHIQLGVLNYFSNQGIPNSQLVPYDPLRRIAVSTFQYSIVKVTCVQTAWAHLHPSLSALHATQPHASQLLSTYLLPSTAILPSKSPTSFSFQKCPPPSGKPRPSSSLPPLSVPSPPRQRPPPTSSPPSSPACVLLNYPPTEKHGSGRIAPVTPSYCAMSSARWSCGWRKSSR